MNKLNFPNDDIFDFILTQIRSVRDERVPHVIGISGIDAAGKSYFAQELSTSLRASYAVSVIHLDDFHNPKAIRYDGISEIDNYLYKSINFGLFEESVLIPLKQHKALSLDAHLLDLDSDQFSHHVTYDVKPEDVVIIEGVFLLRKAWRDYFDLRIFLSVTPSVAIGRGIARDAHRLGSDVERRYEMKYIPAQALHALSDDPESSAHIVIDNNDVATRSIIAFRKF